MKIFDNHYSIDALCVCAFGSRKVCVQAEVYGAETWGNGNKIQGIYISNAIR